jgi:hypothetical protein
MELPDAHIVYPTIAWHTVVQLHEKARRANRWGIKAVKICREMAAQVDIDVL